MGRERRTIEVPRARWWGELIVKTGLAKTLRKMLVFMALFPLVGPHRHPPHLPPPLDSRLPLQNALRAFLIPHLLLSNNPSSLTSPYGLLPTSFNPSHFLSIFSFSPPPSLYFSLSFLHSPSLIFSFSPYHRCALFLSLSLDIWPLPTTNRLCVSLPLFFSPFQLIPPPPLPR